MGLQRAPDFGDEELIVKTGHLDYTNGLARVIVEGGDTTILNPADEAPWEDGINEVVRFDPDDDEQPLRMWNHIDGDLVELGGRSPDHPGLDLLALVIGSEGLLMVVTEVIVKLIPRPQLARVVMASFGDVRAAGDAVASIIAAGIIPAGLEMMDRKATAAVEPTP